MNKTPAQHREMLLRMVGRASDGKVYPLCLCILPAQHYAIEWALSVIDAAKPPAPKRRKR